MSDGANLENEMVETETETEVEEQDSSVSEADESAETEKTDSEESHEDDTESDKEETKDEDFDETDTSEFKKGYISKDAFLKRLNKSKEKRVAVETKLKEKEYLFEMERQAEADPKKLKAMLAIFNEEEKLNAFIELLDGKTSAKKETKSKETPDPSDLVKAEIEKLRNEKKTDILHSYTDEFNQITSDIKVPKHRAWIKNLVALELDVNHKGWRDRHIPNLVAKVYKEVQEEQNKIFNSQKKDYIKKKDSDTSPDVGNGAKGNKIERVPVEDDDALGEWMSKNFAKGA